jgi:branched-chain amino acid transport system permease protein
MDWGAITENSLRATFGQDTVVFALAAIGLNVHFGYTGLLNFGQVAFMAVGAYAVGIAVTYLGWSLWAGLALGIAGSLLLAVILGIPTLRLRADYLAIVTIAASEIFRLTMRSGSFRDVTGGSGGLGDFAGAFYDLNPFGPGRYGIGPVQYGERRFWVLVCGWAVVLLSTLLVWALIRSPWGRVLKAIREDEDAARALGKNAYLYKMQSLMIGGLIGTFGGFVFAIGKQSVQPDSYSTAVTFFAYTALILGGTATIWGPVVGSMIFWTLLAFTDTFLREAVANDLIPDSIMSGVQVGQVRFMLVGFGLVLLMVFRPQGIFGDKNELVLDGR